MKAELKHKWVQALRSGKYSQGINTLRTRDNKYCCLGVLADVSGLGIWRETNGVWEYIHADIRLGRNSIEWPMLERVDLSSSEQAALVRMNDTEKRPFNAIADWIDKFL